MTTHYLVGYDGSETAHRAFELALRMAGADGGRVRAVTALRTTEAGPETCAMMMTDASSRRAREMLETLKAEAGEMAPRVDVELVYGSPGDVLMSQVRAHDIDHVVIGHTPHGKLARWLLGSVSDDVLARARVPVTIVH
jgi:nucleotide-binding universal stress UspA family protein